MISTEHMVAFRVPLHDEHPSEEMIEWLGSSPLSWDGDESGIVFYNLGRADRDRPVECCEVIAAPGDWVVQIVRGNQWVVVPAEASGMIESSIDWMSIAIQLALQLERLYSEWPLGQDSRTDRVLREFSEKLDSMTSEERENEQ